MLWTRPVCPEGLKYRDSEFHSYFKCIVHHCGIYFPCWWTWIVELKYDSHSLSRCLRPSRIPTVCHKNKCAPPILCQLGQIPSNKIIAWTLSDFMLPCTKKTILYLLCYPEIKIIGIIWKIDFVELDAMKKWSSQHESNWKMRHTHILLQWNRCTFELATEASSSPFWIKMTQYASKIAKVTSLWWPLRAQMCIDSIEVICEYASFFKYFHAVMTIFS
jgi:hypothetical protein